MENKKNILLVDDHTIVLDGLRSIIGGADFVNEIYTATSGEEALEILESKKIHIVTLDIGIGSKMDGLEVLKVIRAKWEEIKVLMISMHDDIEHISEVISSGANGYILKSKAGNIITALEAVLGGDIFYSNEVNEKIRSFIDYSSISKKAQIDYDIVEKEKLVLELLVKGKTAKEIAKELNMSQRAVEHITKTTMTKLGVSNKVRLVVKAVLERLVNVSIEPFS